MTEASTGYAPVSGLNLYFECHGAGDPLILLHGGVVGIASFGPVLSELAKDRMVIAVELQDHGRTDDIDRPLRFESMADDIAALVRHLGFERTDVLGYSLGGGVALQTAIRHPEHVVEFFGVLGGGKRDAGLDGAARPEAQLAILPGTTHYSICGDLRLVAAVRPFLAS